MGSDRDRRWIPLQTSVRIPSRGIRGRVTGHEWVDGLFWCYAVEYEPEEKGYPVVTFAVQDEVEVE